MKRPSCKSPGISNFLFAGERNSIAQFAGKTHTTLTARRLTLDRMLRCRAHFTFTLTSPPFHLPL